MSWKKVLRGRVRLAAAAALFASGLGESARGQLAIDDVLRTYRIDFQNTVPGVNNGLFAGTGFAPEPEEGQLDSDAWMLTGLSDGISEFGDTRTSGDFARGSRAAGTVTGGIYAFTDVGAAGNVVLGVQPVAADFTPGSIVLRLRNDTPDTISGFDLAYTAWVFNDAGRGNSFSFSHSGDHIDYMAEPALDIISPDSADDTPAWVSTARNISLGGLTITPGGFFFLQWSGGDLSGSGSRDEFGLDDIILSNFTTASFTIRNLVWSGTTVDGEWNAASGNWLHTGAPATWDDAAPDNAVFDSTSPVKSVNITAPRTVGSLAFNDAGYSLAGEPVTLQASAGRGIIANESSSILAPVVLDSNQAWEVAGGRRLEVSGAVSGGGRLFKTGDGTLLLANAGNTHVGTTISAGVLEVSADGQLGFDELQMNGGMLKVVDAPLNSFRTINFMAPSAIDTGPFDMEFSGDLYGPGGFTKLGTGMLTLSNPSDLFLRYSGRTIIEEGAIRLTATDSNFSTLGSGRIDINGGTLIIDNIQVGIPGGSASSQIFLGDGGTLAGTGTAAFARSGGALFFVRGSEQSPTLATLTTLEEGDVFTLKNSVRQSSSAMGPSHAVVRVEGPGRIILESGATSSASTYAGVWDIRGGILQVGPVEPNFFPVFPEDNPPFGEPLNALGFMDGDPDKPNEVAINGGILAIAVDAPNTNPNITNPPAEPTPDYLRNPITLAGGAIASTGSRVSYGPGNNDPQGVPTDIPVEARLGGDFTVSAGGEPSRVLVYDPVIDGYLDGPRNVHLVQGERVTSAGEAGNIVYSTNWLGVLRIESLDPNTGGSFNVHRTGGSVVVGEGARIIVDEGAALKLNGIGVLSDGINHVDVENSGSFNIEGGSHAIGELSGSGDVLLSAGASLVASHVRGNSVMIGESGIMTIRASSDGGGVSIIPALDLAPSGTLDLWDNDLIIGTERDGAGTLARVESLIASARNFGRWDGPGITSTAARDDATQLTGLAIMLNGEPGSPIYSDFAGQAVDENWILVKRTWNGDTDLNGLIDIDDYFLIDTGFLAFQAGLIASPSYRQGDLDFNDIVDIDDYFLIDTAFLSQNSVLVGGRAASAAPVPEPNALGILLSGAVALGWLRFGTRRGWPTLAEPIRRPSGGAAGGGRSE